MHRVQLIIIGTRGGVVKCLTSYSEGIYYDMDALKTKKAVLFFDLKGWYSSQEGKCAKEIAEGLNTFYGEIIDLVDQLKGRVVKFMGDAGLIIFEKTSDAVGFAKVIASKHEANIGIESGEVVEGVFGKDEATWFDVFGPAVNEAGKNMGKARKSGKGIVAGPNAWEELSQEERKGLDCSADL